MKPFFKFFLILALLSAEPACAEPWDFYSWLQGLKKEALAQGISPQTVHDALDDVHFNDSIIEKDQKQPEQKSTAAEYLSKLVNEKRISGGQEFYADNQGVLEQVGRTYGVPPRFIVALLGVESRYGVAQGSYNIVEALATLAFEGRRADYFKNELFQALRIVDAGHIELADLKGSWAGAMGYCQFMPSSFLNFAQDFNGDGRMDIWSDIADAAASTANYLRANGWRSDEGWGMQVYLSQPIDQQYIGLKYHVTNAQWTQVGVRTLQGQLLPSPATDASLIQPDGPDGPSFIVYNNFRVIMRWNRSTNFALSVGLLADAINR